MNSRGLTLVELLIAIALGSALSLAATSLLVGAQRAYMQDEQLARTQENGHFALRLLSRELAMAGYFGEVTGGDVTPAPPVGTSCYRQLVALGPSLDHFDNLDTAGGSDQGRSIPEGCARPGEHQPGTDALLVRRAMDTPVVRWGQKLSPTSADMLYLRVERGGAALSRGADALAEDASLWRYHPQLYFLRNYSRARGDEVPALCRIRLSPQAERTAPVECLVEGVEQMQLEFGIDSDGDRLADRYLSRPTPQELSRAVVARIQLLLRSPLPLPGHRDRNTYAVGNAAVTAPLDRYYRRVMSTFILLRNSDVHRS